MGRTPGVTTCMIAGGGGGGGGGEGGKGGGGGGQVRAKGKGHAWGRLPP